MFMDREEVEVHNLAKKRGQHPAILTEQAWSVKELLYEKTHYFLAGHSGYVIPSGQDSAILPRRSGSQSKLMIRFILRAHGASHIIKNIKSDTRA